MATFDPLIGSSLISGGAGLFSTALNAILQGVTNRKNYQHFLENRSYNEPVNQVKRLVAAGLNPVLASGGNFESANPPQMVAPEVDSQSFSSVADKLFKHKQLQLAEKKLDSQLLLENLRAELLKEGIDEKNIDKAIKALTLDTQTKLQPVVIQQAEDKAAMVHYDFENYPEYRQGILDNLSARTKQALASADASTKNATTARMNAIETARHNKAIEQIQTDAANMSAEDRKKMLDIARDNYNLAVRKQNWAEAHYWYDLAAGAAGALIKGGASALGWHFGIPIDKFF